MNAMNALYEIFILPRDNEDLILHLSWSVP